MYCIDNGMRNVVSSYHSEDRGRLLENLVFIELKRRGHDVSFFKHTKECDFLIQKKGKITTAIQVSMHLSPENTEREIQGLLEAHEYTKASELLILTEYQEEERKEEGIPISIKPVWKWLVERK